MATRQARTEIVRIATEIMTIDGIDHAARRASALQQHAQFADESPLLFEVLVKDGRDFDLANLRFMMSQIDAVHSGRMTSTDAKENVVQRLTTNPAPTEVHESCESCESCES